ncbi:helix-turn-helix domain-containing protein [Paenibacillus fonticola]|uniref:helix-turn-helix domain-containing protein n=1 Tax=Paenibacillus fonticola TaxID=379896 RepID=UPI0003618AC6|nr:helix-turn-helix domain-containing protein [Paenibacillus fonticola]
MTQSGLRLITLQEAMNLFGVSRATIDRWRQTKGLPYIKIGKEVFIDSVQLQGWVRGFTYEQSQPEPEKKENGPVRVGVGYQSGTAHMWSALLIKEAGFFEEELSRLFPGRHAEVDWYNGSSGIELVEGLIMGRIQIASLGDYPIQIAHKLSEMLPSFQSVLLAFDGKTSNGKGISIVVPPGCLIQRFEDLEEREIFTVPHSSASSRLERLLTAAGHKAAGRQIVAKPMRESMERMMSCKAGACAMWEPYPSLLQDAGAGKILFEEGIGEDYLTGVVANKAWAAAHPAMTTAYLKAHLRAHQLIRAHVDKAVTLIHRSTGVPERTAAKVLQRVRWDAAIYERDLHTLHKLDAPDADPKDRETSPFHVETAYLQAAVKHVRLPAVPDAPIRGEWSSAAVY